MRIDEKIKDHYERPIISLRISITNRCNVDCFYCHHDGMILKSSEMAVEEISRLLKIAKDINIEKIRISGGEPLVRKDIVEIIRETRKYDFKDISITTNGVLLKKYAKDLYGAGLNRVNVSLDTLNPETYNFITRKNNLQLVKEGIIEAANAGLAPIKVNMVVMEGINDTEIWDMFNFCKENGAILQLIELIESDSCNDNEKNINYHYDLSQVERELESKASHVKARKFMQDRKKYFIDGGEIEVVKPMDNTQFCKNCTRLRITPDGMIKPCLLRNDNLIDIITPIRNNATDSELKEIFIEGIYNREPYCK